MSTRLPIRGCPLWEVGTTQDDTGFPEESHPNQTRWVPLALSRPRTSIIATTVTVITFI